MSEKSEDNDDLFEYNDTWDEKNLAPELVLTNFNYQLLSEEHGFGLFTFPLFSKTFCGKLISKLRNFNDWTVNRHRTYPTNDVLIEKFDERFAKIYDCILRNILKPSLDKLYDCEIGDNFTHETFIIRYKPELQGHLDLHHDHSTFTFCVTFSSDQDYEGGGTYFPKHKLVLKANQGVVAVHPGMFTHRHGVRPIISGERYAMVSFCRLNF